MGKIVKISKALPGIIILSVVLCGCGQTQNATTSETTTEQTTEITTTQEETTTEATTEVTTERMPEKGAYNNPYKFGEVATIQATDFWTYEKIVLNIKVGEWKNRDLTCEIEIKETDVTSSISIDEDAVFVYLYDNNYKQLSSDFLTISNVPNGEFSSTDLVLAGVGSAEAYLCPFSDIDTNTLANAKYVVFQYYEYSGTPTERYQARMDECWFEIPQYAE